MLIHSTSPKKTLDIRDIAKQLDINVDEFLTTIKASIAAPELK